MSREKNQHYRFRHLGLATKIVNLKFLVLIGF